MSDSDDDFPSFILLLDNFVRKMRAASRVPKHVSTFTWQNRMLELISSHDGRLLKFCE